MKCPSEVSGILFGGLMFLIYVNLPTKREIQGRDRRRSQYGKKLKSINFQSCVSDGINRVKTGMPDLHRILIACQQSEGAPVTKTLQKFAAADKDEKKFIKPNDEDPIIYVTLGVGDDVEVERAIIKAWPNNHFKFYGAEPEPKRATAYKKIGHIFEMAVQNRTGNFTLTNPENPGVYPTMEFGQFLREKVKEKRIDFMTMDVEGDEYMLLPYLLNPNKLLAGGQVICLLNVELHAPFLAHRTDLSTFQQLMTKLLTMSDYSIVHADADYLPRVLFVNRKNKYCFNRYVSQIFPI